MIIDNKGKLFGRVSVVDLAVILLIIIAGTALLYRHAGVAAARKRTLTNITYTTEVKGVRWATVEAFRSGASVYDGKGVYVGKIVDVQSKPAVDEIKKADGTSVMAQKPDRFDVILTLSASATVTDKGVMIEGVRGIYKGASLYIATRDVTCVSMVRDIKYGDK